ncbi:autotransporter outer membrane beta-barrel domain-containing protein [Sphingomonas sp. CJ20]
MVAAYASASPFSGAFVDALLGRADLSFRMRRLVAGQNIIATSSRDGAMTLAALSFGIDHMGGPLRFSVYGRGEYMDGDLDAYEEAGAGRYNLRFDARSLQSVTGTLGTRIELRQRYGFGTVIPRLRAEWTHEFADVDAQFLDYADIAGAAFYRIDSSAWKREQFQLSLGTRLVLPSLWSLDVEMGLRGASGETAGSLRLQVTKEF